MTLLNRIEETSEENNSLIKTLDLFRAPSFYYYPQKLEVVVTASRIEIPLKENPSATTVMGEEALNNMPRSVAAEEALFLVPGVKVENQANGERGHLYIRGQGILSERGFEE